MATSKLLGILLLIGGLICVGVAAVWSDSAGDQVKEFFTGDFRDKTVWMFAAGVIAGIIGLIALVLPGRVKS